MNVTIQASKIVQVRVVGAMADMPKAIDLLYANEWRVTRSGPLPTEGLTVDPTRFELRAERFVGSGHPFTRSLSLAFKEAP